MYNIDFGKCPMSNSSFCTKFPRSAPYKTAKYTLELAIYRILEASTLLDFN